MTLGPPIRSVHHSSGANGDCEPVNNDGLDSRLPSFLLKKALEQTYVLMWLFSLNNLCSCSVVFLLVAV